MLLTPEAPPAGEAPAVAAVDPQYEDCVARVYRNIRDGRDFASRWASAGGGAPAQHCLAVAELAAGFPKISAIRLEELAERPDAGDEMVRARILAQAALAWIEAAMPDEGKRAIDAAFSLAPESGELQLSAAKIHMALSQHQATVDAVTTAEAAGFATAAGYVLRGRARYFLADYRAAADDVVAALTIEPTNLDALVLRGDLVQHGVEIEASYSTDR
jgi:hypothetical protein